MVHVRLNERETNPNPHINFISVLDAEEEDARQLIRALAAQVKPVMKNHGFTVNSLEEVSQGLVRIALIWGIEAWVFAFSTNTTKFSLGEIGIMAKLLVSTPCSRLERLSCWMDMCTAQSWFFEAPADHFCRLLG